MPAVLKRLLEAIGRFPVARARLIVGLMLTAGAALLFSNSYLARVPASTALMEAVRKTVAATMAADGCFEAASASSTIRQALDAAGYRDWGVDAAPSIQRSACVTAALDGESRRVTLIPAVPANVKAALPEMRSATYETCMDKATAVAYVSDGLHALGESDFEITTDGPVGYPIERREEVLQHVSEGCWVLSAAGWTADGTPLYYVSGLRQ